MPAADQPVMIFKLAKGYYKMNIKVEKNPVNRDATSLVFDLRNSTVLYRQLSSSKERKIIVEMMRGIHLYVIKYLYEKSLLNDEEFAFNDTGDGYLITFFDSEHSFSCILCACHIRSFLIPHLKKYNRELGLGPDKLNYSFGIGLHRAKTRLIGVTINTRNENFLKKKIIIGNSSNCAARVESVTKNFLDIDLLITGHTREEARKECNKSFKGLLNKTGPFLMKIGGRFNVQDGKKDGHKLYCVTNEFYNKYKQITAANK